MLNIFLTFEIKIANITDVVIQVDKQNYKTCLNMLKSNFYDNPMYLSGEWIYYCKTVIRKDILKLFSKDANFKQGPVFRQLCGREISEFRSNTTDIKLHSVYKKKGINN